MEIKQDLTTVNFTPKRSRNILALCIHSMWGTYQGSIAWFKNPEAKASAHYCISAEGEITQCVLDKDLAWHAGVYDEPIADWLLPNPNNVTIGIELEDKREKNWQYPLKQREALVWLCNYLSHKWSIFLDKEHVLLHKDLNPSRRSDPVGSFDINWILKQDLKPMEWLEKLAQDWKFFIEEVMEEKILSYESWVRKSLEWAKKYQTQLALSERLQKEVDQLKKDNEKLVQANLDLTKEVEDANETCINLSIKINNLRNQYQDFEDIKNKGFWDKLVYVLKLKGDD